MAKSHIIPDAFMQRATDAPFMESSGTFRSRKMFTGWYDRNILGHAGEKIIASYDSVAAECFISSGLTYRKRRDPSDINRLRDDFVPGEIYEIQGVDITKIRLFALSLLWRAAVSRLKAFELVQIDANQIEDIRHRILSGNPGSYEEFPVYFGVFCGGEELPKLAPFQPKGHPFFRFFLDGVICYISPCRHFKSVKTYGRLLAGAQPDRLNLVCFPSLESNHSRLSEKIARTVAKKEGDFFLASRGL